PVTTLMEIESAVKAVEQAHAGELRFVVEAGMPLQHLWHGVTSRERAIEVFSQLRIWDTEHNNGVLIYLQLIDRRVEILADRGINAKVAQPKWDAICREMETMFRTGAYAQGALQAVASIGQLLAENFPAAPGSREMIANELPDRPLLL
ncbi:MAG: TPM domain-containing protein, partial [Proteobacteria bacterium]|nr:TPM domain-containing protein [Pseudomonadota bacterium]